MTKTHTRLTERLREKREDGASLDRSYYQQGAIGARLNPPIKQATVSQYEREPERLLSRGPEFALQFFREYGFTEPEAQALTRELFADVARLFSGDAPQETAVVITDGGWVNVYAAGTGPAWGDTDVLETVFIPGLKPGTHIGLKATGDSMAPYLKRGDTAIVLRDDGAVEPGDYCAVWLADDGCVIKRFVRELGDGTLLLESLNPPSEAERYFAAPMGSRVLGKVVNRLLSD